MCCEEIKSLLDAYIDGELSDAQMCAVEEHAKACDACREELQAARLLKDTLAHMDEDLAVPLQAQAAWRNAVRAEAARQKKKKWMRYAYAAAAAFVVFFGASVMLNARPGQPGASVSLDVSPVQADFAVVARDGSRDIAASADQPAQLTVRRKISVAAANEALDMLAHLVQEYNGYFHQESDAACRIELPAQYLEDFTKAAERIGNQVYSEIVGESSKTVVILVQLIEE